MELSRAQRARLASAGIRDGLPFQYKDGHFCQCRECREAWEVLWSLEVKKDHNRQEPRDVSYEESEKM